MAPEPPKTDPIEDLTSFRQSLARHCTMFGHGDFDSVNCIVTLKRTAADFENFVSAYFKQFDLSPGRFNVLMALYGADNRTMSLSDLGDYLVVTKANITGLVDGLVEDGMIRRTDHPVDRRVVLAQLTAKAVDFLNWFVPKHHKNIKYLMGVFTPEQRRELVRLLDMLRGQMRHIGSMKIEAPAPPAAGAKAK